RGQTAQNNDRSVLDELELFSDSGDMRCGDFWTIYSFTYIERLVESLDPRATVRWLEDGNTSASIDLERQLSVRKRGGTPYIGGYEISYPFLLPWKILVVTHDG